jgi:hypothetical protein
MGSQGYYADHAQERRTELARTTPGERIAEAIRLSRFATRLASIGRRP